jgi:surface polysaccharide O-acyltransferase-like enzyme
MDQEKRLAHLDSVRVLAVFMVVGIHTMAYMPLGEADRGIVSFFVHTVAVPIFFLVDGVIFAKHRLEGRSWEYHRYLVKSARRLLVPWVAFSLIYLLMRAGLEYIGYFSETIVKGASFWDVLKLVYSSEVSSQMYFLLSLFFIRVFSLLWYRLNRLPPWVLLAVWACYTALSSLWGARLTRVFPDGLDPVVHAIMGLRFYLLGMVLFTCQAFVKKHSVPIILVSLVMVVFFKIVFPGTVLVQLPYLTGVYVLFLRFFENDNFLSHIGHYTMGIYLVHAPIVLKSVSMTAQKMRVEGLLGYIVVLCIAFLVSLGLARLMGSVKIGRLILGEKY